MGKTTFLELLRKYDKVKIPIIQRDYVQGLDENRHIAKRFLEDIKDSLNEGGIHLDFLYGSEDSGKLILIDGQQRITTLFLLYWYFLLRKRESLRKETKEELINQLSKFSYEIRPSTEDFVKQLLKGIEQLQIGGKLSDSIKNESWFALSWMYDPTVRSMLNMIDLIDEIFKDVEISIEEMDRKITFSFLDLQELYLTDEVYIRMNARGKPLSEFEIFKADIGKCLYDYYRRKLSSEEEAMKIVSKLDNEWLDIFWRIGVSDPERAEKLYFNFLENLTFLFHIEELDREDIKKKKVSLEDFSLIKNWKEVYLEKENYLESLTKILDTLTRYNDGINSELLGRNVEIFRDFLKPHLRREGESINYHERARFYALALFILKKGNPSSQREIYKKWIRVSLNVINNTRIEEVDTFKSVISLLKEWAENIDNLYEFLLSVEERFSQVKEEKRKIKLIKENSNWERELIEAEKHWYLDGQIGFLIDISNNNLAKFKRYREAFERLFNKESLRKESYQTLIHRALLTYGDYLPRHGTSNKYTFCTFGIQLREKEENWRRVFNDNEKRGIFKKLLDHLYNARERKTLKEELQGIINTFLSTKGKRDWRYFFIKNGDIIKSCRNYQIMWISESEIYLNKGGTKVTNWNWKRKAELYTYYFYLTYLLPAKEKGLFEKWEFNYSDSWDYNSIGIYINEIFINRVEIELWIKFKSENGFFISAYTYDLDGNQIYPSDNFCLSVSEKLQSIGFKVKEEEYFIYSKTYPMNRMNKLFSDLIDICKKLEENR